MNGSHVSVPTSAQVFRLEDYRRLPRSDAPTAPPSDRLNEVLATLARCDHFIYAGVTSDDRVHFGSIGFDHLNFKLLSLGHQNVSDFDCESAEYLRDAVIRQLGKLQMIIDAGDPQ
ncbi:hypothetical protein NCW_00214 [Burkholderia pseudomallei]